MLREPRTSKSGADREREPAGSIITSQSYDEIQVFNGVAERTGNRVDRAGVRGRRGVCRSVTDLCAKSRRLGDGYYYLASPAWPEESDKVDLNRTWAPMS